MLTGIDKDEVVEYVSALEKLEVNELPTKFLLGAISCKDRTVLISKFEGEKDPTIFYDIVKKGLRGIHSIKKKNGEVVDINVIDDAAMDILPTTIIKELFNRIIEINFLSEAETKN